MRYLYIDNFRGFSETLIPIRDVNFLVGENSTGKTSILGLLDLFSSHQFWFYQRFDTEKIRFGHFKDIVSAHSDNRGYFTVGMVEDKKGQSDEIRSRGFLITFKERSGLPTLTQYTFSSGNHVVAIKRTRNKVFYKESSVESKCDASSFLRTIFAVWREEHVGSSSGFRALPLQDSVLEQESIPIPLLLSFLEDLSKETDEKRGIKGFHMYIPAFFGDEIIWLAPIRTTPKRTYDEVRLEFSPEGTHTPYIIRKILASKSKAQKFKKQIEEIGKASGLFESVAIRRFGKSATAPFELDIVIDQEALNISTVGYGVSQSLPVIVELLVRSKGSWFAIQQPEVHLHPKAQAALGGLFFELALQEKKGFFIETHSDFLIDRFRLNYKSKRSNKPDAQILFLERKAMKNHVTTLRIDVDGALPEDQPSNYRDFFIKEEMSLLGL